MRGSCATSWKKPATTAASASTTRTSTQCCRRDVDEFSEDQLRRFKELTRDDLAEGLSAAVAEKKTD